MSTRHARHEELLDELALVIDGDRDVIARHADFLAEDDAARDLRHEAIAAADAVAEAGADHLANPNLEEEVLAALEARGRTTHPGFLADPATREVRPDAGSIRGAAAPRLPEAVVETLGGPETKPAPAANVEAPTARGPRPRGGLLWLAAGALGFATAAAAGVVGVGWWMHAHDGQSAERPTVAQTSLPGATLHSIVRAAGGPDVSGVELRDPSGTVRPITASDAIPAGTTIRTDERTRAQLVFADGTELRLNRSTELTLDGRVARRMTLSAGEVVADVAHVAGAPNARFITPTGEVDVLGTKFVLSAASDVSTVRVTRGKVRVGALGAADTSFVEVTHGNEGILRANSPPRVAPAVDLAAGLDWADPETARRADSEAIAGFGSLRARRPGEQQDRERPLTIARANVRVRIAGNVARTEVEQEFANDGTSVLEGIYRFPLPADARVAALSLDVDGRMEEGAFVARNRAQRIWRGVIRNATPMVERRPTEDFIWVPGRWRDPALLEWQRGSNFELRVFPIPAQGSRRVVLAYTQSLTRTNEGRRYVYPLAVSRDGSTRIGELDIDVRVAGATGVTARGYTLSETTDGETRTLHYAASDFVPNGDLIVDIGMPNRDAELAAWTYTGDAASTPPDDARDPDREVVAAQRALAADRRGYVTVALRPNLPAASETRATDYVLMVDSSQSMVGERYQRASDLAIAVAGEMDLNDRFAVLACDLECRSADGTATAARFVAPTADAVHAARGFLERQEPGGASHLGATLRAAATAGTPVAGRRVRVLYFGDGVASVGHRLPATLGAEVEAIARETHAQISTVGIGGDADSTALEAIARAGGGLAVPYVPGQHLGSAAMSVLASTYGTTLENPSLSLPAGLEDIAPARLGSIRAGDELRLSARMAQDRVQGEAVLRGTVAGAPFEQRYALDLTASESAGNLFVPAQWAAARIRDLEATGDGSDEVPAIALSKAYGVLSRHTSLLVLESEAMFRAFGVDRVTARAPSWTGDEAADETSSTGLLAVAEEARSDVDDVLRGALGARGTGTASAGGLRPGDSAPAAARAVDEAEEAEADVRAGRERFARRPHAQPSRMAATRPAPAPPSPMRVMPRPDMGRWMRRVMVRVGEVSRSTDPNAAELAAARRAEDTLAAAPDSRDAHRAAVRALSRIGNVERALEIAEAWIARDRLDPDALIARADQLARLGRRDEAARTLSGVVDLRPDDAGLQERLALAMERIGNTRQGCAHRIALAEADTSHVARMAAAFRCERETHPSLAGRLLDTVRDADVRRRVEAAASEGEPRTRTSSEFMADASWSGGDELDLHLIAPDGTRTSWMGGRASSFAVGAGSSGSEIIGLASAPVGNYLVEVVRTRPGTGVISGRVRVRVRDSHQVVPFTLHDDREVIARMIVRREERLIEVGGGVPTR